MSEVQQVNGEWLTYPAAAIRLNKSDPAVRVQAKREKWFTRKDGKLTEVCVPFEELEAAQRQAEQAQTAVQMASNNTAVVLQQGAAGLVPQLTALAAQLSERDQRIGKVEEQLRAKTREVARLRSQVDALNDQLVELRLTIAELKGQH
jgi:chromosome segregation ATPase